MVEIDGKSARESLVKRLSVKLERKHSNVDSVATARTVGSESENSIEAPSDSIEVYGSQGSCSTRLESSTKGPSHGRKVSFTNLEIREYPRILGDHPGTGRMPGPPVTMEWEHSNSLTVPVDLYETRRTQRRCMEDLMLSPTDRTEILTDEAGHSIEEVYIAEYEARKIISERRWTFVMLPFSRMEEGVESAKRKARRAICRR